MSKKDIYLYRNLKDSNTNSKSEARNSKQISNLKSQNFKHCLGFGNLEFKYCFGFRYSDFGLVPLENVDFYGLQKYLVTGLRNRSFLTEFIRAIARTMFYPKVFCFVCLLLMLGYTAHLSEFIAINKGDMASLQLNQYAYAAWQVSLVQFDVYLYSFFDRADSVIVVEIYGMKEKSDDAQKAIEHFRMLLRSDFIPFFKNNYGIEIDEIKEVKFIYRVRSEEGRREIYIWEKGKYHYPIK